MKNISFILSVLFILLFCCKSQNSKIQNSKDDKDKNLYLTSSFDGVTGIYTVALKHSNNILNTVQIEGWYGRDSIVTIDSFHWIYIYDVRGGSGVYNRFQKLLTVKDNKLYSLYNGLYLYEGRIPVYEGNTPIVDSNGDYTWIVEYDSTLIFRRDTIWYIREKSFIDGKYSEKVRKLDESVVDDY